MSNVRRYEMQAHSCVGEGRLDDPERDDIFIAYVRPVESENGEYILYEDHIAALETEQHKVCKWTRINDVRNGTEWHYYTTACGRDGQIRIGKYCHNCGRRIEVAE